MKITVHHVLEEWPVTKLDLPIHCAHALLGISARQGPSRQPPLKVQMLMRALKAISAQRAQQSQ